MKLHKLFLMAAVGASTLSVAAFDGQAAFAAGAKTHQHTGQRGQRMERLERELNLTSDQKTRLRSIMQQSRQRARSIRQDNGLTAEQKKARLRENRQRTRVSMNAILTSGQKKKLAAMRAAHRQNRGTRKQTKATR